MSKRRFFNIIKRRTLSKLQDRALAKKAPWFDSFPIKLNLDPRDWAKQLKGVETLGSGLVIMKMG